MSIPFKAIPQLINDRMVVRLTDEASAALPSRGMVMVIGKVNGADFQVPLEPDGRSGHWLLAEEPLITQAGLRAGQEARFEVQPLDEWPEPEVPEDVRQSLSQQGLGAAWDDLTTRARWEWLRWIRATKNPVTRGKRIAVACSKLSHGDRRPCCFNSASCTVPELARSGVLVDG